MKILHATLALLAVFALGGRTASANRSSHERAKVVPLVENGVTVGLKLMLTLRPHDSDKPVVRVSLGPNTYTYATVGDHRKLASDPKEGYLLYQWPEITLKQGEYGPGSKPRPITLELKYADAPTVKPGATVELISTWNDGNGSYWHVWGLQGSQSDPASVLKLPKASVKAAATSAPPAATTARTPRPRARAMAAATATTRPRAPRARSAATAATPAPATATPRARAPKKK